MPDNPLISKEQQAALDRLLGKTTASETAAAKTASAKDDWKKYIGDTEDPFAPPKSVITPDMKVKIPAIPESKINLDAGLPFQPGPEPEVTRSFTKGVVAGSKQLYGGGMVAVGDVGNRLSWNAALHELFRDIEINPGYYPKYNADYYRREYENLLKYHQHLQSIRVPRTKGENFRLDWVMSANKELFAKEKNHPEQLTPEEKKKLVYLKASALETPGGLKDREPSEAERNILARANKYLMLSDLIKEKGGYDEAMKYLAAESAVQTPWERMKAKGEQIYMSAPQGKGVLFQLGTFVPQSVGTILAIAASPYTAGTSVEILPALIGGATVTGLTASVYGGTIAEIDDYEARTGKIIPEEEKLGIALGNAAAEMLAESLRLEQLLPKGMLSKFVTRSALKSNGYGTQLLAKYAKQSPGGFKRFIIGAAETLKQSNAEGMEEFLTQAAQDMLNNTYKNPEDRLTMKQIMGNMMQAYMGGAMMGLAMGGTHVWAENKIAKKRRTQTGMVTLFQDERSKMIMEYAGVDDNGVVTGIDSLGEVHKLQESDIKHSVTMTTNDFYGYMSAFKENQPDILEYEQGIYKKDAEARTDYFLSSIKHENGEIIVADLKDGKRVYVKSGKPEKDANGFYQPMAATDGEGNKLMIGGNDVAGISVLDESRVREVIFNRLSQSINDLTAQEASSRVEADELHKSFPYKVGDQITYQGRNGRITDIDNLDNGVVAIFEDEEGNERLENITPDQYGLIRPFEQPVAQPAQPAQPTAPKPAGKTLTLTMGNKTTDFAVKDNGDGTSTIGEIFDDEDAAKSIAKALGKKYGKLAIDVVPVGDQEDAFAPSQYAIVAVPKATKGKKETPPQGVVTPPAAPVIPGQEVTGAAITPPVTPKQESKEAKEETQTQVTEQEKAGGVTVATTTSGLVSEKPNEELTTAELKAKYDRIVNEKPEDYLDKTPADLRMRWYDLYEINEILNVKAREAKIKALKEQIGILKGKKDKVSKEKLKVLNEAVKLNESEIKASYAEVENITMDFNEKLLGHAVRMAKESGLDYGEIDLDHPFYDRSEGWMDFVDGLGSMLFEERGWVEGVGPRGKENYHTPIREIFEDYIAEIKESEKKPETEGRPAEEKPEVKPAEQPKTEPAKAEPVKPEVTEEMTAQEAAQELIRAYVERGDTYEDLKGSALGQSNGIAAVDIMGDKIVVSRIGGKKIDVVFSLKAIYNAIKDEKAPAPVQPAIKEPWQMTKEELSKQKEETGRNVLQDDYYYHVGKKQDNGLKAGKNYVVENNVVWLSEDAPMGMAGSVYAIKKSILDANKVRKSKGAGNYIVHGGDIPKEAVVYLGEREGSEPPLDIHKAFVKKALADGKPVPPEVLKNYPELTEPVKPTEQAEPGLTKPVKTEEVKPVPPEILAEYPELSKEEPKAAIEQAEKQVNTEPTEEQKKAGNYQKGHVTLFGLDITIENPKGSTRSGTDQTGKKWEITMNNTYGYIKNTKGKDGDHIDIFIADNPVGETVFVIDQVDPKTKEFDEHKAMIGFASEKEAREAYQSNYENGWQGLGQITAMPMERFKEWLGTDEAYENKGNKRKPVSEVKSIPNVRDEVLKNAVVNQFLNSYFKEDSDFEGKQTISRILAHQFAGSVHAKDRQILMLNITGEKLPIAKCGITAIETEILKIINALKETGGHYDAANKTWVYSPVGEGQAPVETRPDESTGAEKTKAGGVLEAPSKEEGIAEKPFAGEIVEKPKEGGNLVSDARMEELRKKLKSKLGQLNAGFDPELFTVGSELAAGYIERGIKKFADFAKRMIADFGNAIRPYLKSFYEGARRMPGVNTEGMDTTDYVDKYDFEKESEGRVIKTIEGTREFTFEELQAQKKEQPPARTKETVLREVYDRGMAGDTFAFNLSDITNFDIGKDELRNAYQFGLQGEPFNMDYIKSGIIGVVVHERKPEVKKSAKPEFAGEAVKPKETKTAPEGYTKPVIADKNTKTDEDIWLVKLTDKVDRNLYNAFSRIAKENNGYYSRFKKAFLFKDSEDADNFRKQIDEEYGSTEPRSTEAIESQVESIRTDVESAENDKSKTDQRSKAASLAERIQNLKGEIDEKLQLIQTPYSTEGIIHEYPNVEVEKQVKKDVSKFSKALAKALGWEHDTDRKGKTQYANANIAPAGGDAHFILWKPGSDYGVYLSIPYQPEYITERGGYEGYKLTGTLGGDHTIHWRITTKKNKYHGLGNHWAAGTTTVGEFRDMITKAMKQYDNVEPELVDDMSGDIMTPLQYAKANRDKLVTQYIDENGKHVDTDKIRDLAKEIGYDGVHAAPFREFDRYLTDEIFKEILTKYPNDDITFVIGVPGSGKSNMVNEHLENDEIVYDSVMSTGDKLERYLNGLKDRSVTVIMVNSDLMQAFSGTIKRATHTGRAVPISYFLKTAKSYKGKLELLKNNFGDSIKFAIFVREGNEYREIADGKDTTNYDITREDMLDVLANHPDFNKLTNEQIEIITDGKAEDAYARRKEGEARGGSGEIQAEGQEGITKAETGDLPGLKPEEHGLNKPSISDVPIAVVAGQRPGGTEIVTPKGETERGSGRPGIPSIPIPGKAKGEGTTGGRGGGIRSGLRGPGRGDGEFAGQAINEPEGIRSDSEQPVVVAADENHVIQPDDVIVPGGEIAKIRANIKAIKLVKRLHQEGRNATPDEKRILAQYVGWGGLSAIFKRDIYNDSWKKKYGDFQEELQQLLTLEEYQAARESTINAHYTDRRVIDRMWQMAAKLGFAGGHVLEPAGGIGHFFGLMPKIFRAGARLRGVELDKISGLIMQKLYPSANVAISGFEDVNDKNNSFNLVITNVPFERSIRVYDKENKDISKEFTLHNYFIAKSLRKLAPGGIAIVITTSATMDNEGVGARFRQWMTDKDGGNSDLIDAIRLPNNAFKENAGTEVTTDILIIRKRDGNGIHANSKSIQATEQVGEGKTDDGKKVAIRINEFFARNPEKVLGKMMLAHEADSGGLYSGNTQTCKKPADMDINEELMRFIEQLPEDIQDATTINPNQEIEAASGMVEGTILVKDGKIYQVTFGNLVEPEWNDNKVGGDDGKKYTKAQVVTYYNELKETTRELLSKEANHGITDDEIKPLRDKLNKLYDAFVRRFGRIHGNRKIGFLEDDVEYDLLDALENIKQVTTKVNGKERWSIEASKSDIFAKRINRPRSEPTKADNLSDAVDISLAYRNGIDLDYISVLTGMDKGIIEQQLMNDKMAFINPETGLMEERDAYLSGNVRKKLEVARASGDEYKVNVEELEKVIPKDIPMVQIEAQLGATWIPSEIVGGWIDKLYGIKGTQVKYNKKTDKWSVDFRDYGTLRGAVNTQKYGVDGARGDELIEDCLNQKQTIVMKTEGEGESKRTYKDIERTTAAQNKQNELKLLFKEYLLNSDKEVKGRLEKIYNDQFNAYVERIYTTPESLVHFPGASTFRILRLHQKAAVKRALHEATLLAHQVGSGKTYTLITTAMEMRRLGIARKPVIVVQRATLGQFAESFRRLYPNARLLIPGKKDLDRKNRRRLFAQIAMNDWDCIIIDHNFLNQIPDNPQRQIAYIQSRIEDLKEVIGGEDYSGGRRGRRGGNREESDARKEIKSLEEKIAKLKEKSKEDKSDVDVLEEKMTGKKGKSVKDESKQELSETARLKKQFDRKTDNILYFEDMGIDALLIDEAHTYKRLGFATKGAQIKGIDTNGSKKAISTQLKVQFILERNNGKNVVFSTGTPISNTMAEAWTMMKYLIPKRMIECGISKFDEFRAVFGAVEPSIEYTAMGTFKVVDRFAKYVNLPELKRIWNSVADVVLSEDVEELKPGKGIPLLKDGKHTKVIMPMTKALEIEMVRLKNILKAWNNMSGAEKRKNRHVPLVVFGLARRAAIDVRLINPRAKDDPGSKLNHAIDKILEVHESSKSYSGTQLVFCDAYQSSDKTFNVYEDIKEKLIKRGIPEGEIAIINEDDTDVKRKKLFDRVKLGEIRVLMGSTEKLGIGVNVQERLKAVHHLDAPNRPMDFEQRNGRILRQGNLHTKWGIPVEVFLYGVEKTLDATAYQRLAIKDAFIKQMMSRDVTGERTIEDTTDDESNMTFSEMMATLSGSQYAILHYKKKYDLMKLEFAEKAHRVQQVDIYDTIKNNKYHISACKSAIENLTEAKEGFDKILPGGEITKIKISDGEIIDDPKKYQEAIDKYWKKNDSKMISEGFNDTLKIYGKTGQEFAFRIKSLKRVEEVVETDANGVTTKSFKLIPSITYELEYKGYPISKYNNDYKTLPGMLKSVMETIAGIQSRIENDEKAIERYENEIKELEPLISQGFKDADKLAQVRAEVAELERKMEEEMKEKEPTESEEQEEESGEETISDAVTIEDIMDGKTVHELVTEGPAKNVKAAQVISRKEEFDTRTVVDTAIEEILSIPGAPKVDPNMLNKIYETFSRKGKFKDIRVDWFDIAKDQGIIEDAKDEYGALLPEAYDQNDDYMLTPLGMKLMDLIEARIDTRESVAGGTDLFPETSNVPEVTGEPLNVRNIRFMATTENYEPLISMTKQKAERLNVMLKGINKAQGPEESLRDFAERILTAINRKAKTRPKMVVVKSVDELYGIMDEDSIRSLKMSGAYAAMYGDDTMVVITDHLPEDTYMTTAEGLADMWLHEVGLHYGLTTLIESDEERDDLLRGIANDMGRDKMLDAIERMGGNREVYAGKSDPELADEYLAFLADKVVRGEDLIPKDQSVWEKVKSALMKIISRILGWQVEQISDDDVVRIIRGSVQSVIQGKPTMNQDVRKEKKVSMSMMAASPQMVGANPTIEKVLHGGLQNFHEQIVDADLSVKKLQEELIFRGGSVPEYADAYNDHNRMYGRIKSQSEMFNSEYMEPLVDLIDDIEKKTDMTYQDITHYLMAKHAPERNAYIKLKSGGKKLVGAGSINGVPLDDTHANSLVAKYEALLGKQLTDRLNNEIHRATKYSLDKLLQTGLISNELHDQLTNRYQYYVPLRGWSEEQMDDVFEYLNSDSRNGYENPIRTAFGRESQADDPIPYILSLAYTSIVSGNKNLAKQKLLNLARLNHENQPTLIHFKKIYQVLAPNGQWVDTTIKPDPALFKNRLARVKRDLSHYEMNTSHNAKQHEVEVYENGEKYVVVVDSSVANSLNGANMYDPGVVLRGLSRFTRWWSAMTTSKNPAFVLPNMVRDFRFGVTSLFVTDNAEAALKFTKNYRWAHGAIRRYMKNRSNPDKYSGEYHDVIDYYYRRFMELGGETGYVHLRDIKRIKKDVEKMFKEINESRLNPLTYTRRLYRLENHLTTQLSTWSENIGRFAAFLTAIQNGKSENEAASLAKNITVNFNRKGRTANILGSLYAFWNARIQGIARYAKLWQINPRKMMVISAASMANGFLMAYLLDALLWSGDDDDDEEPGVKGYDKFSMYLKQNYNMIPIPGTDNAISIPLAHGFNFFYSLGVIAYEMATDRINGLQALGRSMDSFYNNMLPVDLGGLTNQQGQFRVRPFVPTAGLPFYDLSINEDFAGRMIYKEPFTKELEGRVPASRMYYKNVNSGIRRLTDALFDLSGGDPAVNSKFYQKGGKIKKAMLDVNPEWIEYIFDGYMSGKGRFYNDIFKTTVFPIIDAASDAAKSDKNMSEAIKEAYSNIDANDIPVVYRFYRSGWSNIIEQKYYKQRGEAKDFEQLQRELLKAEKYEDYKDLQKHHELVYKAYKTKLIDNSIKDINELLYFSTTKISDSAKKNLETRKRELMEEALKIQK